MTISLRTYIILKWLLFIVAVFFMTTLVLYGAHAAFEKKYSERFFPGTKIAGTEIGGMSRAEAEKKISEKSDAILKEGIVFSFLDKQENLQFLPDSVEADIVSPIAIIDIDKSLNEAYYFARTDNTLYNIKSRMTSWNSGKDFEVGVEMRTEELEKFLDNNFSYFSTPALNASLVVASSSKKQDIRFQVSEEVNGQVLDFDQAIKELRKRLTRLDKSIIHLEMAPQFPTVLKKDCVDAELQAELALEKTPIILVFKKNKWNISKNDLINILELKTRSVTLGKNEVYVGISYDKMDKLLSERVAKEIDVPAIDAKFEVKDGRVQKFQVNQNGFVLDKIDASIKVEKLISSGTTSEVLLQTKEIESKNANAEMESFGLKEILGTGHSSYAGSPKNRRHNISKGAASVNGTLIAPGEEFSLLKVLGKIDGTTGYLPELVIKEGKTTPEYGGGLCQIGTTVFRGTVKSGLPVTMRRNHSYRVSYYEPAGTDATIYDPWPDYRFKNDTANHILIQSRMEGSDLYFDFWGTKDGRVATSTKPSIYNIVKPPPTKTIETLDLKPGVKKCTENAHNGADAYFDYNIIYPDGKEDKTRFKSHYVPWQAVCLIGVDKLTVDKEKEAKAASSTVPVVVEKKE